MGHKTDHKVLLMFISVGAKEIKIIKMWRIV